MILWKWITLANPTVNFATPKANFVITRMFIHCSVAFDATSTNNISFGYTGSLQAFGTNTSVGSTGWKTITGGSSLGLNTTSRIIRAYYVQTGTAATVGKALVGIELEAAPTSP